MRVGGLPLPTDAAAYVCDLATGNAELLLLDPEPATFAIRDDDAATAVEGPAPAGTFEVPDLDGARPYIRSRHAIVTPGGAVRMSPAEFPSGAGPSLTLPTYVYTLVQSQYIRSSASPASQFDQPYPLLGTPGSLLSADLRYDSQNGLAPALDERLVDRDRAYLAASLLPLRNKQFDFFAFQQIRRGLQQQVSNTHTYGYVTTDNAAYQLQKNNPEFSETLRLSRSDFAAPSGFSAGTSAEIDLSSYQHDIPHLFGYQFNSGFGYDHTYRGFPVSDDTRIGLGGLIDTPNYVLAGATLNATYGYQLTKYDYPHVLTNGTLTLTGSRTLAPGVQFYGSASFTQRDDRFRDPAIARSAIGLAFIPTTYDGTPYAGYLAFAGLTTYRTYVGQFTFNGRGDNRVQATLTHTRDFPQYHGYGRPPLYATLDVTRRLGSTLRVEASRSYAFGWGGQYLTPQTYFSISP